MSDSDLIDPSDLLPAEGEGQDPEGDDPDPGDVPEDDEEASGE